MRAWPLTPKCLQRRLNHLRMELLPEKGPKRISSKGCAKPRISRACSYVKRALRCCVDGSPMWLKRKLKQAVRDVIPQDF